MADPIEPQQSTRWQKLWTAVHECGHAVARLALDELPPYPGPLLRSVSIIANADSVGRVDGQPRVMFMLEHESMTDRMRHHQRRQLRYDIVQFLAGYVAEMYQRGGLLAPILARDGFIRQILSGELDAVPDFHSARQHLGWLNPPNPSVELSRLWDNTYGLIACEWQGLKRISRVLLEREFMDGEEFEAEWLACRSTLSARRRTEQRIGPRYGGWRSDTDPAETLI
jgi:hypothetical protein